MIHSLYSHREIFLRELISNASDANDKLRFEALAQPAAAGRRHRARDPDRRRRRRRHAHDPRQRHRHEPRGSHRAPRHDRASPAPRSSSSALSGDQQKDSQLIGQFGVGFYSAFIVAERVEVLTPPRRAPAGGGRALGIRAPTANSPSRPSSARERGTTIVLHLKEDAKEFADAWRLRALVRRYSDHIAFPVRMPQGGRGDARIRGGQPGTGAVDAAASRDQGRGIHAVLPARLRTTAPIRWPGATTASRASASTPACSTSRARAPFDLWQRDAARGLKLYVRRVFIMDDAEQFLPLYLRFVKGVLDSSDLPLNVSRELLQQDSEVEAMRGGLTKRVLDLLAQLASDEPAKYQTLLEGIRRGAQGGPGRGSRQPREAPAAAALRQHHATEGRRADGQLARLRRAHADRARSSIYYVIAESVAAARSQPAHRGAASERASRCCCSASASMSGSWASSQAFEGKRFKDAARGDLELGRAGR